MSPIELHQKIFHHSDRLGEFLKTGSTTPVSWELDLTNICNHDCIGCDAKGAGGRTNNEFLWLNEAKNYVDQISSLGAKAVVLTGGGDPMMNRATPDVIEYIKSKGMDVGLISNGSLFNKKNSIIILKNCTWVRISLDSGSAKVFSLIRRRPEKEFFDILTKLKTFVQLRNKINSSCTIGVGFLTSKQTIPDMVNFTSLCKEREVDYVEFRPFHGDYTVPHDIDGCLKMATDNFKVYYNVLKYDKDYKKQYCKCHGQNFSGVINIHKVYVCCHFRGVEKYELGDLRKDSLKKIWNSEKRKNIVNNIDFRDCIALCKLDLVNRTLSDLNNKSSHVNFI
tara:strand:- start:401 stop:1411 length:1011 start_codon:yes stop_codon:yes gene_type:complete